MKRISNICSLFKRIWGIFSPFRKYMITVLFFLLAQNIIGSIFPLILGKIVNSVNKSDTVAFVTAICMWIALGFGRVTLSYLRELYEIKNLDYELSRYMSRISLEKFFNISMGQHQVGHSMIKRSIMSKGEAAVVGIIYSAIYELIPLFLMISIPLLMLLWNAPCVGLSALGFVIVFSLYTTKYNYKFIPKLRDLDTLSNKVSKKQGEVIEQASLVFVNAQEERVRRECDEENAIQGKEGRPVWNSYVAWLHGGQIFISLSQAMCIALSGYLAYEGKISSGLFVTLSMWVFGSLGTLTNISHSQRNLAKNMAPMTKYFKFLDYEPDIVMPKNPIPLEFPRGRIEFRHVSFTYRSRDEKDVLNDNDETKKGESGNVENGESEIPALNDISFLLEEGKRYAFVGKSGAGKSTLVGLILRAFDPQHGHVLIDGVDIRMLDYRELRRNIGLVPQDVLLFDGTLRYNITFGLSSEKSVPDSELSRVSKLSRISEFEEKLEKGWDTVIGERGIKLSGGQRQRVGIARALIKNPHILIFDEATSSLDTENEARIRESIREASIGKTTIIIAHRLATVKDADKIFVFDEGKIVGQGSHKELLKNNDYYKRLVQSQVIMA